MKWSDLGWNEKLVIVFIIGMLVCAAVYANPLKKDDGNCALLAANMQYAEDAIASGEHSIDEVTKYHMSKIDECFEETDKCIFTDKTEAKKWVSGMIAVLAKLVKDGKLPVDGVGNAVMLQCTRGGDDAKHARPPQDDGFKPTIPPQIQG